MIFTLTLNPSLDYFIYLKNLQKNNLNLSENTTITSGGKGINVSKILKNFKVESTAITCIGGFCGDKIIMDLKELNIKHYPVIIKENTRINLKIKDNTSETEIAGQPPIISQENITELSQYLKENIKNGDTLICSGSIPSSLASNIYKQLIDALQPLVKHIKVVLDTRGESLKENLYNNFLIKPNKKELEDMFQQKFTTTKEIIKGCEYFLEQGVQNIIVSLGGEGSLYINQQNTFKAEPLNLKVINTVGAGDSMVAGFMAAIEKNYELADCYKLAVATASATVSSDSLAQITAIEDYYKQVIIKKL